jgi:hypothetical protein
MPAVSVAQMVKIRDHLSALKPGSPFKAIIFRAGRVLELTGKIPSE